MKKLLFLLILSAPALAVPATQTNPISASKSVATRIPNSALATQKLIDAARGIAWKSLENEEKIKVRLQLVRAFSLLGRPDVALRYSDESETDEIWRTDAIAAAQRDDMARAQNGLQKIESLEARLDVLMTMCRAHLRMNRTKEAQTLVARIEKALPQMPDSLSAREIYAYTADLWRRAGDGAAVRRVLSKMPADTSVSFNGSRDDSLGAARFFAVRAGTFAGIDFAAAPAELALDMVRVWGQGGHFAFAQSAIKKRPDFWERAVLEGEIAFYEFATTSKRDAQNAFAATAQSVLERLPRTKESEWGENSPLEIALSLAKLGRFEEAERLADVAEKRRVQSEEDTGSSSYPERLRDSYENSTIWLRLDPARKKQLVDNILADKSPEQDLFGNRYRLFRALRFEGKTADAREALKGAFSELRDSGGAEKSDEWTSLLQGAKLWLAAKTAREAGLNDQAQKLANYAEKTALESGADKLRVAGELFESGFPQRALTLALQNPPQPNAIPGWFWFARDDTFARDLQSPPSWIESLRKGSFARVEAICGWVDARDLISHRAIADDEDEISIGGPDGTTFFINSTLSLGWENIKRYPRLLEPR
jgi:hypothetical protein